jgi:formate hydrogenlyase transcriptional activator
VKTNEPQKPASSELRSFIEQLPALAWSALPDGSLEFYNQRLQDFTGLTPEKLRGLQWKSIIHSDDFPEIENWWGATIQQQQEYAKPARLRRFDGEYRWFQIALSPVGDDQGTLVRWYAISVDIDDLKRSEQKLREDEAGLRTITDAIHQSVVVLSSDGKTLYANRVALNRTGLTPSEVNTEGFFARAFHADDVDRVREGRRVGLQKGIPFELEMRSLFKGDEYRWQLIHYNPLFDDNGQLLRWYATATDIDDRKKAEERLQNENFALREEIDRSSMFEEIVGSCKPMRQLLKQVEQVAPSDSTVLILGETGTGKELIARALHRRSKRASRAFVRVNCAAIPQSLIASELFGHEKGAFTGALQRRVGRFEAADGGTLFLDEIGDLPMETQIALLRVLQEREFERVGSNHPITVDVRVIAATNRELPAAVTAGTFRQDLFYRLNVFPIAVPPLRERADDIPLLVEYFVARFARGTGKKFRQINKGTLEILSAYAWPGNIRELQNVVERAVIVSESDRLVVDESWFKREPENSAENHEGLSALANREVEMIEAALAESHGRISGPSGAAAKLGIPRQTLESKMRRFGISRYGLKRPSTQ